MADAVGNHILETLCYQLDQSYEDVTSKLMGISVLAGDGEVVEGSTVCMEATA